MNAYAQFPFAETRFPHLHGLGGKALREIAAGKGREAAAARREVARRKAKQIAEGKVKAPVVKTK